MRAINRFYDKPVEDYYISYQKNRDRTDFEEVTIRYNRKGNSVKSTLIKKAIYAMNIVKISDPSAITLYNRMTNSNLNNINLNILYKIYKEVKYGKEGIIVYRNPSLYLGSKLRRIMV